MPVLRVLFLVGFWMVYAGCLWKLLEWQSAARASGGSFDLTGQVLILTGLVWVSVSAFLWWSCSDG